VIVEGDAAYGSQANRQMVMPRDADDPSRRWGFVFAIARTWKTVEEKAIKDLVTHLPRKYSQRIRVPRLPGTTGCKTFWVSSTRLCLRHIGDVTVVLRKRGRNVGPKQTKILVTHLDEGILRQVVSAYQRRWPVGKSIGSLRPTWVWVHTRAAGKRDASNSPLASRSWRIGC